MNDRKNRELLALDAEIDELQKYIKNVIIDTDSEKLPEEAVKLLDLQAAKKRLLEDPEKYFNELDNEEKEIQ